MRNLRALYYEQWKPPPSYQGRSLTAATWDLNGDSVLCCFGPSEHDSLIDLFRINTKSQENNLISSWAAPSPNPDLACDMILSLHYFGDCLTACLVLAGGDIIVVREQPQPGKDEIEIVGSVDAGIVAAKWSPDEELLCMVSKADTVIFMSRTFEGIKDVSILAQDLKVSKHVSVGWGSKETQFKGKGARALRDPTMPEKVDEGVLSPNDDHCASLSWRGDGAFVAINTIEGAKRRVIRVYTREGVLDSVSEPVDGLEGAMSWRPAGNLIAGVQRLQGRVDVVFFERNGLRHGKFSLRQKPERLGRTGQPIRVYWNSNSTLLAVVLAGSVELWTMGNYHWYLKQELRVASLSTIPILWHPEKPLRLLIADTGSISIHEYIFTTARGSTIAPYDFGVVAVIDGTEILLTPFRSANIPPPMALHTLSVDANAIDVAFNADSSLIAILQHHAISVFRWDASKTSSLVPEKVGHITLNMEKTLGSCYRQVCFLDDDKLSVLERTGASSHIQHYSLSFKTCEDNASVRFTDSSAMPLNTVKGDEVSPISAIAQGIVSLSRVSSPVGPRDSDSPDACGLRFQKQHISMNEKLENPDDPSLVSPMISPQNPTLAQGSTTVSNSLNVSPQNGQLSADQSVIAMLGVAHDKHFTCSFAQDYSGGLHRLGTDQRRVVIGKFPVMLPWFEVISYQDGYLAFGLSSSGHLYAESRLLVKNCTSFLVTPAHLIFTTTNHLLKCVHITHPTSLELPADSPEVDERCRSIERGARLLTAMPTSFSLVMQMPRGNLETVYPRAMVLASVRSHIAKKNYRNAFTTCRTQRVNMNLLYDYAPRQFLSNVSLFIDQVQEISYIDLFLSSLTEEDVTQTIYVDTSEASKIIKVPSSTIEKSKSGQTGKINKICDAFLDVLKTRLDMNLQNVITANLCKSPPAIEDGLQLIAQLLQAEDDVMAEQAAEHICFLADVKKLYESALGLYNLELAVIIAEKSQEDPREYLPFLQNLLEMDTSRRYFSIDDYLGRHTKALNHLFDMNSFEEFQAYTKKHELYQRAMSLYRHKANELASITALYAQYLESKSSLKEAGLAYETLRDYPKATSCYLASGPTQWREVLSCVLSQQPPATKSALENIATLLCDALIQSKDFFSASTIQLEYLNSIESALTSLCKGYFFADAIHLAALKGRPELLASIVDSGLTDALASATEVLADCKGQLQAQVPRIRELREKALADPLAFYEGERVGDGDIPDDVSVAASSRLSTNNSLFTRYTGKNGSIGTLGTGVSRATSKNRRREERKRARGKKGSVYEEEYLVTSVGRLIERVERVRDDFERLVTALVRRQMMERARVIEANLAEVVGMCIACVPEVYESKEPTISTDDAYTPVGADAVFHESLEAARKPKQAPYIKAFERSSLLST